MLKSDVSGPVVTQGHNRIETGLIGAIATWCEFLHNRAPARQALAQIAEGLDAEAICLSRVQKSFSHAEQGIIVYDRLTGKNRNLTLERSFAAVVLGDYLGRIMPGTIWLKSMLEDEIDPKLSLFHIRRNLTELVIIPLEVGSKANDFVEIHFSSKLPFDKHAVLNMAADTLSRTWRNRSHGIFTEHALNRKKQSSFAEGHVPILASDNPARLSRAEYRVCLLLSNGRTIDAAKEELGVTKSTIRTHLKNIYAKTDCSGQSELMYRLLANQAPLSRSSVIDRMG